MRQDPFSRQSDPRRRSRRGGGLRLWILLLFAGYGVYYYFSNQVEDPVTGQKVLIDRSLSADDEKALGLEAYQQILQQERPVDPSLPIAREVQSIADRLIAKVDVVEAALAAEHGMQPTRFSQSFDWEVSVIESDQANAFCLPGGKMAVYTGLVPVAQNEDAMAVVMGHEIAHALLRHGAQRMAQQRLSQVGQMAGAMSGMDPQQQQMVMAAMGYGYLLPYARKHETEADEVGLMLAAAACFDPREAVPLWERMGEASGGQAQPEFSSTHPNPGTRIQNLQSMMPRALEYRERFCEQAM
ncbi:M48 family metallopeptidase [Luteimonas yindakuii]|uniref:M48 family metallopeptidase n=1 Tax=Luteimonas yindakuii TaxID=2565782 RepID=A0A4Z1R3A8_9GAMM|nr:M48 family metallopeptidase [Luteimonas yindakuii]QCO67833.1 M48 family metallopeptidase [Luteimonas yindakuii]TKS54154.1 M48 family metallopeptidase [Luteimonas yindakuii]